MSGRRKDEPTPAERMAAIEGRQQHLLAELDRLNELVETALEDFAPRSSGLEA